MRHLLAIYRAYLQTHIAVQFQYRVAMIIWLIGIVLEPLVYLIVWTTVARSQGGSAGSFTEQDFAAYYIVLMLVNHLTFTWHMWEYDYRIREGLLSPALLRPLHPIHSDLADNMAYKLLSLTIMIPAALLLALFFRPAWDPPLWAVVAGLPSVLLALFMRFLLGWAIAMAAFWTTRIAAINQMYFVSQLFFSGQIAPLELLPAQLQTISLLLPFRWELAFPVELLLGRYTPAEALSGFAAQLLWLLVAYVLVRLVWRSGVRRYGAFGA